MYLDDISFVLIIFFFDFLFFVIFGVKLGFFGDNIYFFRVLLEFFSFIIFIKSLLNRYNLW